MKQCVKWHRTTSLGCTFLFALYLHLNLKCISIVYARKEGLYAFSQYHACWKCFIFVIKMDLDELFGSFNVKFNMAYWALCHHGILSAMQKPKILSSTITDDDIFLILVRYFNVVKMDIYPSSKLSNKMPPFWNYLAKYPCFKLNFLEIEFQWKTRFLENKVIWNQTFKKIKIKIHATRVPCKNFSHYLIFIKLSFLLKLNFLKIKFQNMDILLDNFRIRAFCYIFWTKWANAHFGLFNIYNCHIKVSTIFDV